MKKLFSFFSFFLLIFLTSCSNDTTNSDENAVSVTTKIGGISIDEGQLHNDIVREYELYKDKNGALKSFDDVVAFVDNQLRKTESPVTFSEILDQNPLLREKLIEVANAKGDLNAIKSVFDDMYNQKISKYEQYKYSNDLMDLISQNEGDVNGYYSKIAYFEDQVQNDGTLDSATQDYLLGSGSIATGSHYFWYEEPGNPDLSETQRSLRNGDRIVQIAGADTAGALTAVQSGAVAAASVFGGWGSLIVLVGCVFFTV